MVKGKAGFHNYQDSHTAQSGLNNGKLGKTQPHHPPKQSTTLQCTPCPECGCQRLYRDGLRYLKNSGKIQRWLCRSCGYRFSERKIKLNVTAQAFEVSNPRKDVHKVRIASRDRAFKESSDNLPLFLSEDVASHRLDPNLSVIEKGLNVFPNYNRYAKVCATQPRRAKNLAKVETQLERPSVGGTEHAKGKIIEFAWWLKKQGRSQGTLKLYTEMLRLLVKAGCNLLDPESVKETLAQLDKSNRWKLMAVAAYTSFLKMHGGTWDPPSYRISRKLPFIPLEKELDALIAGCGKKTATFLQLLKETAMRAGEALRLKWTDVDFERKIIILNEPEKGGNPRVFSVSSKLMNMLKVLPKNGEKVFNTTYSTVRTCFVRSRKRLARKLDNPRLNQIKLHSFRHWKATTVYHETKNPLYVMEMLGHRHMDTTLLYVQLDKALFKQDSDDFIVNVAKDPEEIKALLEVGFEYVCQKDGLMFFKKRKVVKTEK